MPPIRQPDTLPTPRSLDHEQVRRHLTFHYGAAPRVANATTWLVSFMQYDLGYFDHETCRPQPSENPFSVNVLPMSPVLSVTHVSGMDSRGDGHPERLIRHIHVPHPEGRCAVQNGRFAAQSCFARAPASPSMARRSAGQSSALAISASPCRFVERSPFGRQSSNSPGKKRIRRVLPFPREG